MTTSSPGPTSGQGGVDRVLGAVGDDDLLRRVADGVGLLVPLGDGLAQLGGAGGGGVARVAGLGGAGGGGADVLGGGEVRLAEAEVEDVDALGLHLLGLGA